MAFIRQRQVSTRVDCDGCGDQWHAELPLSPDAVFEPVFDSRTQARTVLEGHLGWVFTTEGMWCADCVQRMTCAEQGHAWQWAETARWVYGEPMPAMWLCTRCDHYQVATDAGLTDTERDSWERIARHLQDLETGS